MTDQERKKLRESIKAGITDAAHGLLISTTHNMPVWCDGASGNQWEGIEVAEDCRDAYEAVREFVGGLWRRRPCRSTITGELVATSFGFFPGDNEQPEADGSDYLVIRCNRGQVKGYAPGDVEVRLIEGEDSDA